MPSAFLCPAIRCQSTPFVPHSWGKITNLGTPLILRRVYDQTLGSILMHLSCGACQVSDLWVVSWIDPLPERTLASSASPVPPRPGFTSEAKLGV